jgi:phage shock protein E
MDGKFVIDVRTQAEWDSGHVEQAIHIPHGEIANRINEVTSDKNAEIVVYCAAGSRAGRAKVALEQLVFTNVENAGGYDDIKQRYE